MADVRDILELERSATPELTKEAILGNADKQKKKLMMQSTPKMPKRPEGMHREVFALLYNDNKDAPPLFPTDTGQGYKQLKAKLGMRKVRPWKWMPFTNPARKDGAVFHHWRRVADEGKEYPFAKFNKQVPIPTYSDVQYIQHLQSESWSRAETDHLFDLARRFDLRFGVMRDRWDFARFPDRSIEDLKERYYNVCTLLTKSKGGGLEGKLYVFDADHERRRKEQLKRLYERTPEQIEEEQNLLNELRKIEVRKKERDKKTQDLQKLIIAADNQGDPRKLERKIPRKKLQQTRPRMDTNAVETAGIKFPDMKSSGVFIRSQKMKLPANIGQKKMKAIEQLLQELNIELNPMPTEDICHHFNELRSDMVLLYELKSALTTCEFELQTLRHRYEAFNPGKYRETKTCPDRTCNQAIMLVTDSVAGNLTEVFEAYNWFENRTHIPVRVFTYLIGREVTKVREIQWMACLNRGYYVHIQAHSEVRDEILRYIPVIARPLVLQGVDHPLSWTHAFIDFKDPKVEGWLMESMHFKEQEERLQKHIVQQNHYFSQSKQDNLYILRFQKGPEDGSLETTFCEGFEKIYAEEEYNIPPKMQEYHLMTSVSGPAFDHKINRGNETREAQLLGVAGTDVPIKEIEKLTLPYKIGANGYAFMITNNGYLVMHPDFRPVYQGKLRANYGSVDVTEVELIDDDDTAPRKPHEKILELREAMINHTNNQVTNISHLNMKFHYDDMMRVGAENRNYYFAGIEGTPFTIGLALPEGYGNYWIKAGNIIKRSKLEGVPLTSYFTGNWKVHPDWVYCDHFITRKNMTHEGKLVYFMKKIQNEKIGAMEPNGWKTKVRFQSQPKEQDGNSTYSCNTNKVTEDDYFCDTELMQLLVFDAKSTDSSYKDTIWRPDNNIERDLVKKYGVSVRFVATQSGLTRWQHVTELAEGELSRL